MIRSFLLSSINTDLNLFNCLLHHHREMRNKTNQKNFLHFFVYRETYKEKQKGQFRFVFFCALILKRETMFADVSMCQKPYFCFQSLILVPSIPPLPTMSSSAFHCPFNSIYTLSVSFLQWPFLQNSSFRNSSYVDDSIWSWYLLNLNQFGAISCFWRPPPPNK